MDLTVFSVCVGTKYHPGYVYALKEAISKYLTIPHQFRCITTLNLPGITTVKPFVPYPGWWSKIGLFAPTIATGPSLYFDLDVVITGNIDYLAEYTKHEFAAPANWARSGHGGIQSSVMAWAGNWTAPYDRIKPQWPEKKVNDGGYTQLGGKWYWGDQEYIWDMLGDNWVKISGIGSYKYHVRDENKLPEWMKVCVFHGEPKPIDVRDKCLSQYTSILRKHINENTGDGLQQGLKNTA